MSNGANSIHFKLRSELEDYIKSQYFGKSPLLLNAIKGKLDAEGLLYKKPYIESAPAYKTKPNGMDTAHIPDWMRQYFIKLSDAGLGVYPAPFNHQIEALERAYEGSDLFVSTGTGSGKTECFMWPLLAKLTSEAHDQPETWEKRGVRSIIMYPMNALVSDQVSRLRRLIGDPQNEFVRIFRETCGEDARRPQFGMYTGRTPYPGIEPKSSEDHKLERTLHRMTSPQNDQEKKYYNKLVSEGKVPAKSDMNSFLARLHNSQHIPNDEDAELITRYEIQQFCPDILITNYSMLEYMLLRPQEAKIWEQTKAWLRADRHNKLLFIIDEAHMYRGSSGGEVALLIRRLFHKLEITRQQVQFILTTASMPNGTAEDKEFVKRFALDLTASDDSAQFSYLTGEREDVSGRLVYDIPFDRIIQSNPDRFENESSCLQALNEFWKDVEGAPVPFADLPSAYEWMYDRIIEYRPFYYLIKECRGTAVSLSELATSIFPDQPPDSALFAVGVLLAIAPLAKSKKNAVLFPARMHMLFRGIKGVYACANESCPHSHSDGGLTLGEVFLSDGHLSCPHCSSVVYELYNDRRCGALFYKGYILEDDLAGRNRAYLWHYSGQLMDRQMKEIHLFIPSSEFRQAKRQGKNPIRPCYLDVKSGFIDFQDDSKAGKPGIRKLYYCDYSAKGRPQVLTFPTCPHCLHQLSKSQLTSFSTRGNQSFFNLIKSQFLSQPPVAGKTEQPDILPNEGRKVLLFSDSRQRAARLARDMSEASDDTAARQLFALAINYMEQSTKERSMDDLYDYFCLAAALNHVQIFHEPERRKFAEDCKTVLGSYERSKRRGRDYEPRFGMSNAPLQMQKHLLRLFCGGYNTLQDSAIAWIEPTDSALLDAIDILEERGLDISEEDFLALFNAWIINVLDSSVALGQTISDLVRYDVRANYGGYGLDRNWSFSKNIKDMCGWNDQSQDMEIWKDVLRSVFLDTAQPDNGKLYIDLTRIKPRFDPSHIWFRCEQCSELTPFLLYKKCPSCGSDKIHSMDEEEIASLDFWRKPIENALQGEKIRIIDTEEHTAQLSHKDQRDNLWSKTEEYELRFQDLIQQDETPVDILSSTTTMEVGIDIGSLIAVGLRNIPPMRENYQQRAGRAGRRGSSLSTIVTFCEDGPHDTLYFSDPVPMFRGDPRKPWIDVSSEKLIQRHLSMVFLQEFLKSCSLSMDRLPAAVFVDEKLFGFLEYIEGINSVKDSILIPDNEESFDVHAWKTELMLSLKQIKQKRDAHPELYGVLDSGAIAEDAKSLLDALYEDGVIPTYSFPKNVVSTYISNADGKLDYQVERGLDVAIGEYAPGRAIVVDKRTYQIGGLYYPGSERRSGRAASPARAFVDDPNYLKDIQACTECGWFGLDEDHVDACPFCGNTELKYTRQMLRPWGFAPRDGEAIPDAQLSEEYTAVQQPLYSTLPDADEMQPILGWKKVRIASRKNQRIIMMNKGSEDHGFMVCKDCGAAFPGNDSTVLDDIRRPYKSKYLRGPCKHNNTINVNLGYDFVTDMLVIEFALDDSVIDTHRKDNPWLNRAAQSFAEALRLTASKELDIEFTELVTGYRLRSNSLGSFLDVYLYDSLSSGAGYAVSVAEDIQKLLAGVENLLASCDCEDACHKCLKHYRNQYVHGLLDRSAAIQLLRWGRDGVIAPPLSFNRQKALLLPLSHILEESKCPIFISDNSISTKGAGNEKEIIIYPAMWVEPRDNKKIYVSDAYLRYAKPYAVRKIEHEMKHSTALN